MERLFESGIIQFLQRRYSTLNSINERRLLGNDGAIVDSHQKFTVEHIFAAVVAILAGLALATVALIFEVNTGKLTKI